MKAASMLLLQLFFVLIGLLRADGAFQPVSSYRTHSAALLKLRHPTLRLPHHLSHELNVLPRCASTIDAKSKREKSMLLKIRGGAFVAGQEMITFGQNLAGTLFALLFTMYGLACGFAPKKSAKLFYGFSDKDKTTGTFLMRAIGSFACGIGLTAAFGISSEVDALGHLPSVEAIEHAMAIGVIPRILFLIQSLFTNIPSMLRLSKLGLGLFLAESSLLAYSLSTGKFMPDLLIKLEVAAGFISSSVLFFKPSAIFKKDATPSPHEEFFTRLAASYKLTLTVMWAALWNPHINALPSVGLASLAWVASMIYLTFIRKDVEECGSSVVGHIGMMAIGVAVAAGGLRHYLVM